MKLNLGCSDRAFPGYLNVDICQPCDAIVDLRKPWPWPDNSIDEILAYDVVEHLPDRIFTLNEMWRVLKPGARAIIEVPDAAKGPGQWQDPTHVSAWTRNTFQYFTNGSFAHKRLAKAYGIKAAFRVVELQRIECDDVYDSVTKVKAVLEAVK